MIDLLGTHSQLPRNLSGDFLMTGQLTPDQKIQSGRSVAFGIIAFAVGLVVLLLLVKYLIG